MKYILAKHPVRALFWNYVALCVVCTIYMHSVSGFTVKTCNDIGTFQQLFGISLPVCAEECLRRQRCQLFMFRFGMNNCALKDDINIQSLQEEEPVCTYYIRGDWSDIDLGPCNGHICSETERCANTTDDAFECIKSECQTPDDVADATLLSNSHSVGATNMYKCNHGFLGHGTPTITCSDNAEWSTTYFRCERKPGSCPAPQQSYSNADLTRFDGVRTPGTIITFTCRAGYRQSGTEWTSTCQTSLQWNPSSISCCPGDTIIDDTKCYSKVEGAVASSYTGANEYCDSIGRTFVWTIYNLREMHNKTITRYALQPDKISLIPEKWNYTNCAAENGVQGDDSKSLQEKINDVIDNDWDGDDCWYGSMWYPGQPGTSEDDCIVRDLHDSGYRHYSYPCNFTDVENVGFSCGFKIPSIE